MMRESLYDEKTVKQSLFPSTLFWVFFLTLLLMSGMHEGLLVLAVKRQWSSFVTVNVPLIYWAAVAAFLTLYTRFRIRKTYEEPVHRLADATRRVAAGDFSVYVPTVHTQETYDYLDVMILDFNKMVEELGSIETLKTDFFSNVSHEIKTPLAVIQSNVELLDREHLSEAERREYVETIRYAVRRLADLISNMLKLNKLEKQAIKPVPQNYDLCRQLCDCALQFEEVWERKEIEFEAEMGDEAWIEADPGLMELVWTNLLSNAFKFTGTGGTVRLTQKQEGGRIQISVADTGCGMNEETRKHIFDKFYQGDTSHSMEGNGLGLALVKRILELSDGSVWVESREGEGSEFFVELPAADGPAQAGSEAEEMEVTAYGKRVGKEQ